MRRPSPEAFRLPPRAGEVIDRNQSLSFTWRGRRHHAYAGDTIASALLADGERVFSRSFKYHRPRGVMTASSIDPGCLVHVDDEPNVRAGHRLVSDGMEVHPQNAWPSLDFDVKAANRLVGRFLGAGFYYKTFIKPRSLRPAYQAVLRRFGAGGWTSADTPGGEYDKRHAHPDVVVAGGGPAGMRAAIAAAEAGATVMLVEDEHELGGHLRWGDDAERRALAELRDLVAATQGIEVMTNAVVLGRYEENWLAVLQRGLPHVEERLVKARAGALVVAPGLVERPYVFEGNDLPGVMLSTAARRLVNLHAVKPGERAVVLTANPEGDAAVDTLRSAGVEIARVLDARRGEDLVRARGGRGVTAVECGDGQRIDCDLAVTAIGWTAPTSLVNMAGDRPSYDEVAARFFPSGAGRSTGAGVPTSATEDVLPTGGLAGDGSLEQLLSHGGAVGAEAARRALGRRVARGDGAARGSPGEPAGIPELPRRPHPALFKARTNGFVDFSEDVTAKDLVAAAREGYDSVELLKRYTTVTMGPPQGKLETVNAVAVLSAATGRSIEETGTTVWRPPYAPVTLGALAGRRHEPVRVSPMQGWHDQHGATRLVAGAWIRPDSYGDPAAEVRAVRERVGLIDVTPLGKLDLRGPDVPKLLELLYTNKWSKLDVGRVRYGVMCTDDGVVFDDGVTGRLAEDRYVMTTTSSGAGAVWEWIEHWLQTEHPHWRVHVVPLTTGYASINIAGPRSRELLARVAEDVDLSAEAFPYMHVRSARIGGVPDAFTWRIGFTGELSYEIHVPASYGLAIWELLMREGSDLGVAPVGIEAQRVLRLEKGHLVLGQDTDALTQGFSAGVDWAVKLDKPDFVGKPELAWQKAQGEHVRLVGLQPEDATIVPPEASQIVDDGERIIGRITSSRMSPTLGRSICLGFVPPPVQAPGSRVTVVLPDGRRIAARVQEGHAHVDPEGVRMRV